MFELTCFRLIPPIGLRHPKVKGRDMKQSKQIALSTMLCLIPALVTTAALGDDHKIRRVLVISIDGMHALDFALWIKNNPSSAVGKLAARGVNFTNATSTKPSD